MRSYSRIWQKYSNISIILFFALIIRLILLIFLEPWTDEVLNSSFFLVPDTKIYHKLALGILSNNNFDNYDYFRTPGYPLFIAFTYKIFGVFPWVVVLFQIFSNLISIFLTYILAKEIFNKKIAIFSAIIFAIEPHSILHSLIFLADTFLTTIFLFSATILYFSLKRKKISLIILSAVLLGIATYFKQITQYYFVISIFLIFIVDKSTILSKIIKSGIYFTFFLLTILPWMTHNYVKFNHFKFATTQGYNLLFDNASIVESNLNHIHISKARQKFRKQIKSITSDSCNVFDYAEISQQIALDYLKKHTELYLKYHFNGVKNLFLTLNTHTFMRHFNLSSKKNPVTLYSNTSNSIFQSVQLYFSIKPIEEILFGLSIAVYLLIVYVFFLIGLYSIIKVKNYFLTFFILSTIMYFALLPGAIGYARYKLPIIPFYTIICVAGFIYLITILKNKKKKLS